jgi:hypothetical protein
MIKITGEDDAGDGGPSIIKVVLTFLIVLLILTGILYALYPFVRKPLDTEE